MFPQDSYQHWVKDFQSLLSKMDKRGWLLVLGLAVGVAVIGYGLYQEAAFYLRGQHYEQVSAQDAPPSTSTSHQLVVDVSGAVKQPGIYSVEVGTRVGQVLELAGGVTEDADASHLATGLNLAQEVTDQQKIHLPSNQTVENTIGSLDDELPNNSSNDNVDTVSINDATIDQLTTLKGVGEKRAEEIVAGRPYSQLTELVSKKVLSQSLFDELQSQLRL